MVKTFRELWLDEEGHSTSFETHKYPGDLGTWMEKAGSLFPATCLQDTEGMGVPSGWCAGENRK